MTKVTIEGSITPSAILPRGHRRTVQMTARIQRLIDRGYVVLVEDSPAEPVAEVVEPVADPEPGPADDSTVPAGNASRETWAQFLTDQGIDVPDDYGRDGLIALWYDR